MYMYKEKDVIIIQSMFFQVIQLTLVKRQVNMVDDILTHKRRPFQFPITFHSVTLHFSSFLSN